MPNAETLIQKDMEQQDTGNHPPDATGADKVGGTRTGAGNVEPQVTHIEKATDVDRVAALDETAVEAGDGAGPVERAPERDERGML